MPFMLTPFIAFKFTLTPVITSYSQLFPVIQSFRPRSRPLYASTS